MQDQCKPRKDDVQHLHLGGLRRLPAGRDPETLTVPLPASKSRKSSLLKPQVLTLKIRHKLATFLKFPKSAPFLFIFTNVH